EMRIGGQRGEDPRDLDIVLVVDPDELVDGVRVAEIFAGGSRGHHDAERFGESLDAIALDYGNIEDAEEIVVGEKDVLFVKDLILISEGQRSGGQQPGH